MRQSSFWEKLKDFSTVAAGAGVSLYVLGYIIHVVHYFHVLGVDTPLQPLEYIKTGGDFGASVLISIPQLFSHSGDYFPFLFRGVLLTIATASIILSYLGLLFLTVDRKGDSHTKRRGWLRWLTGLFLLGGLLSLVWQEQKLLTVKDVLQAYNVAKVREAQENIKENGKEPLNVRLERIENIYSDYADSGGDKTEAFDLWNDWYNLKAKRSPRQSRLSLYLALLFLNVAAATAVWLYRRVLKRELPTYRHRLLNHLSVFILFVLLIFFSSFAYAVAGKSYDYPVVVLKLSSEDAKGASKEGAKESAGTGDEAKAEKQTHPVYLVEQTDAEIIVYDRLDFFKIKYVPRSRVTGVSQLFVASPFEMCATKPGVFAPCEASWSREDLWVEDF